MRLKMGLTVLAAGLVGLTGCGPLSPAETTVRLVNNSDFPVSVTVYVDDDQDVLDDLIDDVGTELTFTLAAGETQEFTRSCDDLQAAKVDPASLNLIGQVGPNATSRTLRDGSDFNCRDIVTFTFDHSAVIVDFNVAVAVTR